MNLKSKLLSIINKINGETGEQDTNVTDAVRTLIESGGGGGIEELPTADTSFFLIRRATI